MKSVDLALFYLLIITNEARVFEKCELYNKLKELGVDGYQGFGLGHWICLVLYSSKFDTEHYEFDGRTPYFGLFVFNGLIWCTNERHASQNKCNIHCDKFLDDDITDDVECAKKVIQGKDNMMAWPQYENHCTHPMPEMVAWECPSQ